MTFPPFYFDYACKPSGWALPCFGVPMGSLATIDFHRFREDIDVSEIFKSVELKLVN